MGLLRDMRLRAAQNAYQFDKAALYKKGYRLPAKGDEIFDRSSAQRNVVDRGIPFAAHYIKDAYGIGGAGFKAKKIVEDARAGRAFPTAPEKVKQAPGSASTQIKISGPSQAEQIAAGMQNSPRKQLSNYERVAMGDKDMRSLLAEEKLRIVDQFNAAAGKDPLTFSEKVDVLNSEGFQQNDAVLDAFQNDERMQAILQAGNEGKFNRPEYETNNFVGEGQFGRVSELAPGYVIKEQPPLVEWGGYSEEGSPQGNLVGRVFDYRDVAKDVSQMNHLNKMHIGPKVEAFNIANDGSTEVVMRDLRDNFETGETFYDRLNETQTPQDFLDARLFNVKRAQQEAASAHSGLLLGDRHDNNVMRNTLTGRPIQIDPSGVYLEPGAIRDEQVAIKALDAINAAGLQEEGEIYAGLFNEARDRGDLDAVHSLAQQGLAMAQKIKHIPTNYNRAFTPTDDLPF